MTVNHVVHANLASKKAKQPKYHSRRLRIPLCRCYSSGSDLSQYLTLNLTVAVAQRPCSGDRTRGGRVFMLSFFFCPSFSSCRPLFHQHRPVYSFSLTAVLSRILAVLLTCFCFDFFTTSSLPSPTTAQAAFCSRDDVLSFCRACLFYPHSLAETPSSAGQSDLSRIFGFRIDLVLVTSAELPATCQACVASSFF